MSRELREQLILDLLQDSWTKSNTHGLTPNITFGWYEKKQEGTPLLTVGDASEGPTGGGETGYDSINATGSGPEQTKTGLVRCNIWTHRDDLANASTDHQREYNGAATDEVDRIARANAARPTNPRTNNEPVLSIAPGDAEPRPEPDKHAVYRKEIPVRFLYRTA